MNTNDQWLSLCVNCINFRYVYEMNPASQPPHHIWTLINIGFFIHSPHINSIFSTPCWRQQKVSLNLLFRLLFCQLFNRLSTLSNASKLRHLAASPLLSRNFGSSSTFGLTPRLRISLDGPTTYTKILGESQIFSKFRSPKQFIFQLVYSIFL